jgi:hypothetical protein
MVWKETYVVLQMYAETLGVHIVIHSDDPRRGVHDAHNAQGAQPEPDERFALMPGRESMEQYGRERHERHGYQRAEGGNNVLCRGIAAHPAGERGKNVERLV